MGAGDKDAGDKDAGDKDDGLWQNLFGPVDDTDVDVDATCQPHVAVDVEVKAESSSSDASVDLQAKARELLRPLTEPRSLLRPKQLAKGHSSPVRESPPRPKAEISTGGSAPIYRQAAVRSALPPLAAAKSAPTMTKV